MQGLTLILAIAGGVIILGLSLYAGMLLAKLKRQNELQAKMMQEALDKRNAKIVESVDVIAAATLQEQCDLSEAAIRLFMIMDHLQGEMRIDFPTRYPALFELYEAVKDTPRGEARKALAKKERMRFDLQRMKDEARLEQAIRVELEEILVFTGARAAPERTLSS